MVDWNTQCEAISRKTNQRCPHRCCSQIPNILAGHFVMDGNFFTVYGRPVHLCHGHSNHWWSRRRRLLTVKLIDGGYLSPYNSHGYGSVVTTHERIDFAGVTKIAIPRAFVPGKCCGKVPDSVREALKLDVQKQA